MNYDKYVKCHASRGFGIFKLKDQSEIFHVGTHHGPKIFYKKIWK